MKFSRIRITILCVVGAVLIAGSAAYLKFYWMRPIGHGPAGPDVSAAPFKQPWSQQNVVLVGIGDSVTSGFGADSRAHCYFNRLATNPSDEFPDMQGKALTEVLPNLKKENLAVSGSTSADHLATIEDRLSQYDNDVFGLVVMTSGGNDLIHSYGRQPPRECAMYGATLAEAEPWIKSFQARLAEMLDKIAAKFPGGCEIYLADIYDPTDGIGDAPSVFLPDWPDGLAILGKYNEVIRQTVEARPNVHLVPLHETFLGHGSHCCQFWRPTYVADDPHYWFYENIEDPNDRGYDAIRRIFLNAILANCSLQSKTDHDAPAGS